MENLFNKSDICNIPDHNTIVYKDECAYCFNTLESPDGLFICMKTFVSICKNHLDLFYSKSLKELFLNLRIEKRFKVPKSEPLGDESEYKSLLKEAFAVNKFEIKEYQQLFFMPTGEYITLPSQLPPHVQKCVDNILLADCIAKVNERAQKSENWEDKLCPESKHARTLMQLNNQVRVPPTGWKCAQCDLTTNLWLNLTDGMILCGRKFFDGSGGNNHAIEHYKNTGYPLAVKLGTITPERADVFSYDEDNMVIDPLLSEHLAHFGIDLMKMHKTDKSVEEIELESIKRNREQIAIMESESNLEQLYGPGYTGIINTGNSCYINSVVQVVFSIPSFRQFYADRYLKTIQDHDLNVINDVNDFRIQFGKLGYYLNTNDYSYLMKPFEEKDGELINPLPGVTPQLFRKVIGENHSDFSTKQQQDALEFLIHLMNLVQKDLIKYRNKDGNNVNPLEAIMFKIEDRIFCETSQTVKYQFREEPVLSLPISLEDAININQIIAKKNKASTHNDDEAVKPTVKLESCLHRFIRDDVILDYIVNGKKGMAFHSSKLETFPDFLWIHLKRFTVGDDWTPKKLDVEVIVPDEIDLSYMKAIGLQPGEIEMKDDENNEFTNNQELKSSSIELNLDFVNQLINMGFPENACKKAVFFTENSSVDDAANWLMIHIGEPDFNDPLPTELSWKAAAQADSSMPEENDICMMINMGFTRNQAVKALQETNNLERAADWAFNHINELQNLEDNLSADADTNVSEIGQKKIFNFSNGTPKYCLVAFISHIGNNAHVGHYVCHIKQHDGSWALFNDEKVQKSVNPPKQFAYLYLYRRIC